MKSLTTGQLLQTRSAIKLVMNLIAGSESIDDLSHMLKRINGVLIKRGAQGIKEADAILPTEDVGLPVPIFDWTCPQCETCQKLYEGKYGRPMERIGDPTR